VNQLRSPLEPPDRFAHPTPFEGGEEPVTGRVELPALEPGELAADDRVMPLKQLSPGRVAQSGRQLRRADDVREEDGREHPLRADALGEPRDEALSRLHRRAVSLVVDPPSCRTRSFAAATGPSSRSFSR
jgi:hypothetical protein